MEKACVRVDTGFKIAQFQLVDKSQTVVTEDYRNVSLLYKKIPVTVLGDRDIVWVIDLLFC